MSTKYGRYTIFYPSIGESKTLDLSLKFHPMYRVFVLCHIAFLYDSCNIFIMCKIPPKMASRGACFQNSPTPSALLLCAKINMVLKFLTFMIPGGYLVGTWQVSRKKMTQGTLEIGTPMWAGIPFSKIPHEILCSLRLPPNTQFMGSKPILLVL